MKIEEQNGHWSLQRLLAEETLRAKSLRMRAAQTLLALTMAVAALIFAAADRPGQFYVAFGGSAVTLISVLVLEVREKFYREAAVECKEQFDAALFGVPPTGGPRGRLLTEEEVCDAAAKSMKRRARLRDWYPDPGGLPHGFAVLLCQRASLVWDIRLRRRYAAAVLLLAGSWVALGLSVSLVADARLRAYLLTWLVPSTALLVIGVKTATVHRDVANRRERLLARLSATWTAATEQNRDVGPAEVRGLQQAIFQIRNDAPVLPALFTRRHTADFYAHMTAASEQLKGPGGGP